MSKNPPVDAWLLFLASHLRGKGRACDLAYDDRRQGKFLALSVPTELGLCELDVHRVGKGAILILCAESAGAGRVLADVLGPLHRDVRRIDNAKRKFVHRVERMAAHLQETFEERSRPYPAEALTKLRELFPEAEPMVGIEGLFRERDHEPESIRFDPGESADKRQAREASRYPTRFAARLPTPAGGRAALFEPDRSLFRLRGEAEQELPGRLAKQGNRPARDFAVANDPSAPAGSVTGAEAASSVVAASACGDCGGIDLPDCEGVDMPDCSGCDIST
ncbi:MAG: hypothetical protein L0Z62_13095 [Gemmataceae bacterium]|nr:hypothetical protein [Gemmataceae bacterium]